MQTKLTIWFCGAIVVLLAASQFFQFLSTLSMIRKEGIDNYKLLEKKEIEGANDVHDAIQFSVMRFLEKGEMEIFDKIIELRSKMADFREFSLYGPKATVTYSSDKSAIKRTLPDDLKSVLFSNPSKLIRQTAGTVDIYQPYVAVKSCIECHTDWKEGQICGASLLSFDASALKQMKKQSEMEVEAHSQASLKSSLWIMLLALGVTGFLAWLLTRSITAPIQGIAAQLSEAAAHTQTATEQVATASDHLSQASQNQVAALQETSASLEQMSSMTKVTADNALAANDLAKQTKQAADAGVADMNAMDRAMVEIKTASDDISKIIKSIDEIAFQTNLLALNAAVEAARAGEAGMGFAVVADEVRNLAQRSAGAARETAEKIETAIAKSKQGVQLSAQVSDRLNDILAKARKMDEIASQVAEASKEQTNAIQNVNACVQRIETGTQTTSATVSECTTAADALGEQSSELHQAVLSLKRLVEGEKSQAAATRNTTIMPVVRPVAGDSKPFKTRSVFTQRKSKDIGTRSATRENSISLS